MSRGGGFVNGARGGAMGTLQHTTTSTAGKSVVAGERRFNDRAAMKYLLLLLFCLRAAAAEPGRPNVLFLFADDWGKYAGAYRGLDGEHSLNEMVKTPNFDRLAREGVLFTRAHVNAPSCTPCRSALLSGQYFWRTGRGAILRGAVWDSNIPSYPLLLQKAGWHIGFTGKVWSPGRPADAPYGAPANRFAKAGMKISSYSELMMAAPDREARRREIMDGVAKNFSDFLAARKGGEPWCYWFGPTQTHRVIAPGSGKALWGIEPDSLKGKVPPFLPDNDVIRADLSDYLGEVQSVDAALGVLLTELENRGEAENTLVVVSGDHGMPGVSRGKCNLYDFGTHVALAMRWPAKIKPGRVVDDFVNLMDLAPTFLEVAGEKPAPEMTGRSLMNVLTAEKSGQVDAARSYVITGRERHVDTARAGNVPYPQRCLRTAEFAYIRNFAPERWPMGDPAANEPGADAVGENTRATFADMDASPTKRWLVEHGEEPENKKWWDYAFAKRPAEELYDLRRDPHEMTNLASDPAFAEVKAKLSAQLMEELKRTGDPRVTGDGQTFEKPPFTDVEARGK
jgi:N-sulfoglucosamine sulfohydrolase